MPRIQRYGKGFTLLEVIVVLVLVGILASFAILSIGDGKRDRMFEQEGKRLLVLLDMLRDEAILGGEMRAVGISPTGYSFLRLYRVDERSYEWLPDEEDPILRSRDLSELDIVLRLYLDDLPVRLDLTSKHPPAHLFFGDSGDITAFAIHLQNQQDARTRWIIRGEANGRLSMSVAD